ncbi:hypothetical protein ACFP1Z_23975 [Streptomyces gamaensis]|uniref:Helix-turn-helix domain-containing protein n=1 Tax=Streptomyces gamaensis TaxID=1763542 RepID=A0ABW0Z5X1_9ACTN
MLRHVIAPTGFFTQIPNEIIRNTRIGSDAFRLLSYQLSLPDGANLSLSESARRVGIKSEAFKRAKKELKAEGFVHEWRSQGARGRWSTQQLVSNVPLSGEEAKAVRAGCGAPKRVVAKGSSQVAPSGGSPAVGRPTGRSVGRHPENTGEKKQNPPSQPSREEEPPAVPDAHAELSPDPAPAPSSSRDEPIGIPALPNPELHPLHPRAVQALDHLSRTERRFRLSRRDIQALAPFVAEWLLRGASLGELREALTSGLPEAIHCPAALVRDRLTRKMPPLPRLGADEPARAPRQLQTCAGGCGRVFRPVGEEVCCGDCRQEAARRASGYGQDRPGSAVDSGLRGPAAVRAALRGCRNGNGPGQGAVFTG